MRHPPSPAAPAPAHHPWLIPLLVVVAGVTAVAVGVVIGLALGLIGPPAGGGGGVGPPTAATASATPSPTPAAPATPSPPSGAPVPTPLGQTGALEVDALAEVLVDRLNVRAAPGTGGERLGSVNAGERGIVVKGPELIDGVPWYEVAALGLPPNAGCEPPFETDPFNCPYWIGWIAGEGPDGDAWLRAVEPSCPDPTDYRSVARLQRGIRLACFADVTLELTAWWAGRPGDGCVDPPPGVEWLYCPIAFGGWLAPGPGEVGIDFLPIAVDPDSGVALPDSEGWVAVTGHLGDPASEACRVVPGNLGDEVAGAAQVHECRATLVVESMTAVDAP